MKATLFITFLSLTPSWPLIMRQSIPEAKIYSYLPLVYLILTLPAFLTHIVPGFLLYIWIWIMVLLACHCVDSFWHSFQTHHWPRIQCFDLWEVKSFFPLLLSPTFFIFLPCTFFICMLLSTNLYRPKFSYFQNLHDVFFCHELNTHQQWPSADVEDFVFRLFSKIYWWL